MAPHPTPVLAFFLLLPAAVLPAQAPIDGAAVPVPAGSGPAARIWDHAPNKEDAELWFRRTFELRVPVAAARLTVSCDNWCEVFVNGESAGTADAWEQPTTLDVGRRLQTGDNVIALHCKNLGGPAALALWLDWRDPTGITGSVVTDADWLVHDQEHDGWNKVRFDAARWAKATVTGQVPAGETCWGGKPHAVAMKNLGLLGPGLRAIAMAPPAPAPAATPLPEPIVVDGQRGRDDAAGDHEHPLRSLSAAIALLPALLTANVTIELAGGQVYGDTGGHGMPKDVLQLAMRMRPGIAVRIVGQSDGTHARPVLGWAGSPALVLATEGEWQLENLQIGSFATQQRRGVMAQGPVQLTLRDLTFRTRSDADAGIHASRGAHVALLGAIRLNEHLHGKAADETFAGVVATEHATVKFEQREGALLELGNGSLIASYYGCIRLGCATARITCWTDSNNLGVDNSGRIDLHDTTTTLCARKQSNIPIGPEHDGHILAEGARIVIEGDNDCAIALQKASTFTCNDIELKGTFRKTVWAMSGSTFVGRFLGDVTRVEAHTGAGVHIEKVGGTIQGPLVASSGGTISLPDGTVRRSDQ